MTGKPPRLGEMIRWLTMDVQALPDTAGEAGAEG